MSEGMEIKSLETLPDVIAHGLYVVSERRWGLKNDTIGAALSLDGAMRLVLDAAGFGMWVSLSDTEDPEAGETVTVDRNTVGAAERFEWHDECAQWPRERFAPGIGEMRARWEGELTGFIVEWVRIEP